MTESLEDVLTRLPDLPGPFVIVGRPHSGTRALAAAFERNGIGMGPRVSRGFLDSELWYARFVLPLLSGEDLAWLDDERREPPLARTRLADTLRRYWSKRAASSQVAWGWKMSETLFLMSVLRRHLPGAKFVHVIRDGRDVALSDDGFFQLTSPAVVRPSLSHRIAKVGRLLRSPAQRYARRFDYRRFCLNVTFGTSRREEWKGIPLDDPRALTGHRFLLQMQSWVHCVSVARRLGAAMGEGYRELRYAELCQRPAETAAALFESLGVPAQPDAIAFLEQSMHTRRIEKWRNHRFADESEERDFASAVEHGRAMLQELGYVM